MKRAAIVMFQVGLLCACSGKKRRGFEEAAAKMNPQLLVIAPKLATYIALARHERGASAALYDQCRRSDPELTVLASIELGDELELDWRGDTTAQAAKFFLAERDPLCWHSEENRIRTTCRWFCSDRWEGIVLAIDRFADAAGAEGVMIYRLPHVPKEAQGLPSL